jgi:hypothetical protein
MNFDNIFLAILYLIFIIPGVILKLLIFNLIAILTFNRFVKLEEIWKKKYLMDCFGDFKNLIYGIGIFIIILIIW